MKPRQYGVRFSTRRHAEQVENWLTRNCTNRWNLQLSGISEDSRGNLVKQLIVFFDTERDRLKFKNTFFAH